MRIEGAKGKDVSFWTADLTLANALWYTRLTLRAYKATTSDMTSLSMWKESATRASDPTAYPGVQRGNKGCGWGVEIGSVNVLTGCV